MNTVNKNDDTKSIEEKNKEAKRYSAMTKQLMNTGGFNRLQYDTIYRLVSQGVDPTNIFNVKGKIVVYYIEIMALLVKKGHKIIKMNLDIQEQDTRKLEVEIKDEAGDIIYLNQVYDVKQWVPDANQKLRDLKAQKNVLMFMLRVSFPDLFCSIYSDEEGEMIRNNEGYNQNNQFNNQPKPTNNNVYQPKPTNNNVYQPKPNNQVKFINNSVNQAKPTNQPEPTNNSVYQLVETNNQAKSSSMPNGLHKYVVNVFNNKTIREKKEEMNITKDDIGLINTGNYNSYKIIFNNKEVIVNPIYEAVFDTKFAISVDGNEESKSLTMLGIIGMIKTLNVLADKLDNNKRFDEDQRDRIYQQIDQQIQRLKNIYIDCNDNEERSKLYIDSASLIKEIKESINDIDDEFVAIDIEDEDKESTNNEEPITKDEEDFIVKMGMTIYRSFDILIEKNDLIEIVKANRGKAKDVNYTELVIMLALLNHALYDINKSQDKIEKYKQAQSKLNNDSNVNIALINELKQDKEVYCSI